MELSIKEQKAQINEIRRQLAYLKQMIATSYLARDEKETMRISVDYLKLNIKLAEVSLWIAKKQLENFQAL